MLPLLILKVIQFPVNYHNLYNNLEQDIKERSIINENKAVQTQYVNCVTL